MISTPGLLGHKYLIYAQCSVIFSPLTHIPLRANKNMKQDDEHSLSVYFLSSYKVPLSCYWTEYSDVKFVSQSEYVELMNELHRNHVLGAPFSSSNPLLSLALHFSSLTPTCPFSPELTPFSSSRFLPSSSFLWCSWSRARIRVDHLWTSQPHPLPSLTHYNQLGDRPRRGRVDESGEIILFWIIHPSAESTSTLLLLSRCSNLLDPLLVVTLSPIPPVSPLTLCETTKCPTSVFQKGHTCRLAKQWQLKALQWVLTHEQCTPANHCAEWMCLSYEWLYVCMYAC